MSTKKTSKKIVHIFCEGVSEKNYFEALKGNKIVSGYYVLKPNSKENDLSRAIQKSKRLDGVDIIVIYVYDSDTYKHQKKITDKIKKHRGSIYFSEENFEDFLKCHRAKALYRDKKPNLSRHLVEEVRGLNLTSIKKCLRKPSKFKDFKSIYDLLIELFSGKL